MRILFILLFSLLACPAVSQEKPTFVFHDRERFAGNVYEMPERWQWHHEAGVVGFIYPVYKRQIAEWLRSAPQVSYDAAGIEQLWRWFSEHKYTSVAETFTGHFGNDVAPELMYCDQATSFFRTLLMSQGFTSRVVVFEFDDDYGGASHTFPEVWAPDLQQWLYVDPHYQVMAKDKTTLALVEAADPLALLTFLAVNDPTLTVEKRRTDLIELFSRGAELWYVENASPLYRHEFRSEIYPKISPAGG